MGGKNKQLNPADLQRKKERKLALKKNKKQREVVRENVIKNRNLYRLQGEIEVLIFAFTPYFYIIRL